MEEINLRIFKLNNSDLYQRTGHKNKSIKLPYLEGRAVSGWDKSSPTYTKTKGLLNF